MIFLKKITLVALVLFVAYDVAIFLKTQARGVKKIGIIEAYEAGSMRSMVVYPVVKLGKDELTGRYPWVWRWYQVGEEVPVWISDVRGPQIGSALVRLNLSIYFSIILCFVFLGYLRNGRRKN